jgi:hypothetical protein
MNLTAAAAVTSLDLDPVKAGDVAGSRPDGAAPLWGAVRPVGVAGVLVVLQHGHSWRWFACASPWCQPFRVTLRQP